jgi:hypothetical protein
VRWLTHRAHAFLRHSHRGQAVRHLRTPRQDRHTLQKRVLFKVVSLCLSRACLVLCTYNDHLHIYINGAKRRVALPPALATYQSRPHRT